MKKLLEQTEDLQVIEELHLRHGRLLRMMGFNLVYAPVVDVLDCFENQVIGDRSFSEDPERVVYFAKAVLCGLKESGILSCMKHFPGHGHTQVDSHLESVFSERSYEEIWEKDLLPYRELFSDSIMTAHIIFKGCAGVYPATFSTFWLERVLRKKIESKASLISDDLHMQAAVNTYPDSRERILESLEAGNDYYLWCKTKEDDLFLFEREYNLPEYPLSPAEPLSYSKSEWDDHHSFFSSVFSD